jgi:hypothetical protein
MMNWKDMEGNGRGLILSAERSDPVINTPASYSGDPGFKSRSRRPAILIEVFRCFPQSLQAHSGTVP